MSRDIRKETLNVLLDSYRNLQKQVCGFRLRNWYPITIKSFSVNKLQPFQSQIKHTVTPSSQTVKPWWYDWNSKLRGHGYLTSKVRTRIKVQLAQVISSICSPHSPLDLWVPALPLPTRFLSCQKCQWSCLWECALRHFQSRSFWVAKSFTCFG